MLTLALETSGTTGSVALVEAADANARLLAERPLPPGERTARTLLPAVQSLLRKHACRPADLGLIATTTGPGSFTGLRLGVVAAKTLAYATGAPLVGVHTLAAIAAGVGAIETRLWTVLDAQRGELFAACFETRADLAALPDPETEVLTIEDWLNRLAPGAVVAGPPLAKLRDRLPHGVIMANEARWSPAAAAVAQLAIDLHHRGAAVDPLALVPNYYRKSAAEEKAKP